MAAILEDLSCSEKILFPNTIRSADEPAYRLWAEAPRSGTEQGVVLGQCTQNLRRHF
jgi:hypothetical protein